MVNPIIAGILIILEIIIYYGVVCGLFVDDLSWFLKDIMISVLPKDFVKENYSWFTIDLPVMQSSLVVPMVAPIMGVLVTYLANILYSFLVEQKDKKAVIRMDSVQAKILEINEI